MIGTWSGVLHTTCGGGIYYGVGAPACAGTAAGAGAGGATVLATRGEELKFDAEQLFEFTLNEDMQIRIQ